MSAPAAIPVLAVHQAEKRFGAVHALKRVSLEAYRGEVLALLLAKAAGLNASEAEVVMAGTQAVALIVRFDVVKADKVRLINRQP